MIIFLICGICALIVFNVWNLITLNSLKKQKSSEDRQLNDEKYYELKYKSEFLVAVFTVIVAIGGFLGYNSFQNIKTEMNRELKQVADSINLAKDRIKKVEKDIKDKDSLVMEIDSQAETISTDITSFSSKIKFQKENLNSLITKIELINSNNLIKQNFYIVKSIGFPLNEKTISSKKDTVKGVQFLFKDLYTTQNDKLPKFEFPPILISAFEKGGFAYIVDVTKDTFFVACDTYIPGSDSIKFSLIIMEK